jgi:Predicted oxidoreductases (related to aryl-alcohol dehydrogenases)
MQLADGPGKPALDTGAAVDLLRRAVDSGIDHVDTAQFYGDGLANEFIRRAFAPYRDDIVIATKIGAARREGSPSGLGPAQKPHELRASVEQNLASLGLDRLPVVYLRRADVQPGIIASGDQLVDLDDQLAELIRLRNEGKIGGIGLSNVRIDQLRGSLPAGIASVQNSYNLLDRSGEALLELCIAEGIAWVPFFPLGSGFPGMPKVTEQPEVVRAARELGASPAQVALAWQLQHAPNTLLIFGTRSIDHLAENVAAGDLELDAATIARLDTLQTAGWAESWRSITSARSAP